MCLNGGMCLIECICEYCHLHGFIIPSVIFMEEGLYLNFLVFQIMTLMSGFIGM